jgi:ribosomal protein S18 acetylase RimI-like enzyme
MDNNTFSHRHTIACFEGGLVRGILIGYDPKCICGRKEALDYSGIFSGRDLFFLRLKKALIGLLDIRGRGGFYIQNVSVERGYRRRGVGTALVEHIMDFAGREGFPLVFLFVAVGNRGARRIYERMGFHVEKTFKVPFTGIGAYRMVKEL